MGVSALSIMSPVSMSWSRKKVVTPVRFSPWMMAQLMGAAPRYCGSRAAGHAPHHLGQHAEDYHDLQVGVQRFESFEELGSLQLFGLQHG